MHRRSAAARSVTFTALLCLLPIGSSADIVGPAAPTTCVVDSSVAGSPWVIPSRATASDDLYAFILSGTTSQYLKCTGFSLNVPSNKIITGIVVENEADAPLTGDVVESAQRIVLQDSIGATDRASSTPWGLSEAILSHGSPTDRWGECWCSKPAGESCDNPTCGNVNASDFGAAVAVANPSSSVARIDQVRISVYYTDPPCGLTAPSNPCIPGNGSRLTDCQVEWLVDGTKSLRRGVPKNKIICYEGDPACDDDPDLDNASCSFRGQTCINNHDPRMPKCNPSDIATVEIGRPAYAHLYDAADTLNLATLEGVFGTGGFGFGVTLLRDGVPYLGGSANGTSETCSEPFEFVVPLGIRSTGTKVTGTRTIQVSATTGGAITDKDSLKLLCRPSTCGDGIMQAQETCDDHNRINGDGCNQGCQTEAGPTATPTSSVPTATPTITATPTTSATPTNSATPSSSPTTTSTPTVTASPTPTVDQGILFNIQPGGGSIGSCRGTCSGGTSPGASCLSNTNCGAGGTCSSAKHCVGGPLSGTSCVTASQCNGCSQTTPLGSCAIVQSPLTALKVALNGVCFPRTLPDVGCSSDVECPSGKTCRYAKLNVVPGAQDMGTGEIPLTVPQSSVVLNPATIASVGTVCVAAAGDGIGRIDCDGGSVGLNSTIEADHNTGLNGCVGGSRDGLSCASSTDCPGNPAVTFPCVSNACSGGKRNTFACGSAADCPDNDQPCNSGNSGSATGLADDPTCDDTFTTPDGAIDYACREGTKQCSSGSNQGQTCGSDGDCPGSTCALCNTNSTHPGACNSPNHFAQAGTFASGDISIVLPLTIAIHTSSSTFGPDGLACTADDVPPSPPAVTKVVLSTGVNSIRIYDAGNVPGASVGPGESCSGTPCVAQVSGVPVSCPNLLAGSVAGTKFGGGFPAFDANATLGDLVTTFQFVAQ